jgi:hypothetical protein
MFHAARKSTIARGWRFAQSRGILRPNDGSTEGMQWRDDPIIPGMSFAT